MFVNRYKILAKSLATAPSGSTMVIPFSTEFFPVDNSELVQSEFVEKETEKSINPIIDYEKSRFIPYAGNSTLIPKLKIKLWENTNTPTYYSTLGITNDDVKFLRNRFINTFIRLSFYDSEQVTNNNFLFDVTYFSQLGLDQRDPNNYSALTVSNMPVSYISYNPITLPNNFAEGYYLYWLTKDVINGSKNIYMRATLNNAVNGVTTQLYAKQNLPPRSYDSTLFDDLNVKYTIFKDPNDGVFKYNIDNTNRTISISPGSSNSPGQITINLYKLFVQ